MIGTHGTRNSKERPTIEELHKLLSYDPETGFLTWKPRQGIGPGRDVSWNVWNGKNAGKRAFTAISKQGYHVGNINNHTMIAHRVAFAMANGYWPKEDVDHINGVRTDNRIANLREASRGQNMANAAYSNARSGIRGVKKIVGPQGVRWAARVGNVYIGRFNCATAAQMAVIKASIKRYGAFSIFNRGASHA